MSVVVYPNQGKWVALKVSKDYVETMLGVALSLTIFDDTPVYILDVDFETCKEIFQAKTSPLTDKNGLQAVASLFIAGDSDSISAYKDLVSSTLGGESCVIDEITRVTCVTKPYSYSGLLVDSICGMPLPLEADGTPVKCDCARLADFNPGVLNEFFETSVSISDEGLPVLNKSCIMAEAPVKKYGSLYDEFRGMFE